MPDADKSPTLQRYRIRVTTADGQSVISEVVTVERDAPPSALVLRAEHGSYGLWSTDEAGDPDAFDPEPLKLLPSTRDRLAAWAAAFDAAVHGELDENEGAAIKAPGFASQADADAFQAEGESLCKKLNLELNPAFAITYQSVELEVAEALAPDQLRYLLKAERGCSPLWAYDEAGDPDALDFELLALTDGTKTRLQKWAEAFDATAGGDDPSLVGFADQAAADAFGREGEKLAAIVQRELGKAVLVVYEAVPVEVMPEEKPKAASYLLKAERGCSPLWSLDESGDPDALDLDLMSFAQATKDRLQKWAATFDATLNEEDPAASGFADADAVSSFELEANSLVAQLQKELGDAASVTYEAVEMPVAEKAQTSMRLVLKPEHGCSPLWTLDDSGDLDALELDLLPLADATKARVQKWAAAFEATVSLDDPAASGFATDAAASAFRDEGAQILAKLQRELGAAAQVTQEEVELTVAAPAAKTSFTLKAELGCPPLWSLDDAGDLDALDLDLISISVGTKARLRKWSDAFDAVHNSSDDPTVSGFADAAAADAFRSEGTQLVTLLQGELGPAAQIDYDASAEMPIAN